MTPGLCSSAPARTVAQPALRQDRAFSLDTARLAVRCLHAELTLHPKPGLVSLEDNGSHTDMNARTFLRSMFALRHYFKRICRAGFDDAPFHVLKQLGIAAERRMLQATGGINTHRGAIFSSGMLCAAIGRARSLGLAPSPATLHQVLLQCWGMELAAHTHIQGTALHACDGAREEGALGFPSVFNVGLPAMQATLAAGRGMHHARIDTLFALMAHISDSNVVQRGGPDGASMVRRHARQFIDRGGSAHPNWHAGAMASHRLFVAHHLSPGGAADLLAATCLVYAVGNQ